MKLVIVETPEKAAHLAELLGKDYLVKATLGAVRTLRWVEPGGEYATAYRILEERELALAAIRKAARRAETIYLATDPDREGELLACDILDCLAERDRRKAKRLILNNLTPASLQDALDRACEIDLRAVYAACTREMTEYFAAAEREPLLRKWGLLDADTRGPGLAEIAALRLVVECEQARQDAALHPSWEIAAQLEHEGVPFWAAMDDTRDILSSEEGAQVVERLMEAETDWVVERVERHTESDAAPAPFTTITLLAEAERVLRFSTGETSRAAHTLYEAGLITFPRTQSTAIAGEARQAAQDAAAKLFGEEHLLPPASSTGDTSQEADNDPCPEAIRPADPFRLPEEVPAAAVGEGAAQLYALIWKRFIAAHMKPARSSVTLLTIRPTWTGSAEPWEETRTYRHPYTFRARLSWSLYGGYTLVTPSPDKDRRDSQVVSLPDIEEGDRLTFGQIHAGPRVMCQPERYTEATLIAELDQRGIGRLPDYGGVAGTLLRRGWLAHQRGALIPTRQGEDVLFLHLAHFEGVFDLDFLAGMEDLFNLVGQGKADPKTVLDIFYSGRLVPALDAARRAVAEEVDDESVSPLLPAVQRKEIA